MKPLVLEKAHLEDWIKGLSERGNVFAPVKTKKGNTEWQRLEDGVMPEISPGVPKNSIKTFFFPQPETLFEFKARPKSPDAFRLKEPECPSQNNILFGVRPCDARSVVLNSMPYENDPYFQKRLEDTVIIGLLCSKSCSTCFCQWTGGSPTGREGMDIAMIELEDSFYVEALSEKGGALLDFDFLKEPTAEDEKRVKEVTSKQQGQSSDDTASKLRSKDLLTLYNSPFWQEVSDSCINCGTCTFLCPTCYCFDIQDETLRGKGRRIRYWDSCMFPLFTQHASGHNPRGDKLKRVRNRFMHKFKYFPDRFGPLSCVGCGRCVRDCPVNIDIRQVLNSLLSV